MHFCLPLVVVGVGTSLAELCAHRVLSKGLALWAGLPILLACVLGQAVGELAVAAMYLRPRAGDAPDVEQARQALRQGDMWPVLWGLMLRYVGWGMLAGLCALVAMVFVIVVKTISHMSSGAGSGIGAAAGGVSSAGIIVVLFAILAALLLSRFLFVVPMLAIFGGESGPELIGDSVRRTRLVQWQAVLVALMEIALAQLIFVGEHVFLPKVPAFTGWHVPLDLVVSVLNGCWIAYFVLVRTELALQLLDRVPMVPRLQGEMPWSGPVVVGEAKGELGLEGA